MKFTILSTGLASVLYMLSTATAVADPIIDGGFEQPAVTIPNQYQSGYFSYTIGQSFGGPANNAWTVVGSGNNVALASNTESTGNPANPTYYNSHSGGQSLDLTGTMDNGARVGVSQTIDTTAGASYLLSFWVGSFTDAATTLELDVNGAFIGDFTNPNGGVSPGQGINYANFLVPITAVGGSTALAFYYGGGQSVAELDDVSVTNLAGSPSPIAAAAPEPGTWLMMIAGFGLAGTALRRRKQVNTAVKYALL